MARAKEANLDLETEDLKAAYTEYSSLKDESIVWITGKVETITDIDNTIIINVGFKVVEDYLI